ncbi:MAG: hypothetical protein LUD00_10475 [Prevotellaceae bacterium]|nr:hypothetical protein [Prevotellaceae bacterium]
MHRQDEENTFSSKENVFKKRKNEEFASIKRFFREKDGIFLLVQTGGFTDYSCV